MSTGIISRSWSAQRPQPDYASTAADNTLNLIVKKRLKLPLLRTCTLLASASEDPKYSYEGPKLGLRRFGGQNYWGQVLGLFILEYSKELDSPSVEKRRLEDAALLSFINKCLYLANTYLANTTRRP